MTPPMTPSVTAESWPLRHLHQHALWQPSVGSANPDPHTHMCTHTNTHTNTLCDSRTLTPTHNKRHLQRHPRFQGRHKIFFSLMTLSWHSCPATQLAVLRMDFWDVPPIDAKDQFWFPIAKPLSKGSNGFSDHTYHQWCSDNLGVSYMFNRGSLLTFTFLCCWLGGDFNIIFSVWYSCIDALQ